MKEEFWMMITGRENAKLYRINAEKSRNIRTLSFICMKHLRQCSDLRVEYIMQQDQLSFVSCGGGRSELVAHHGDDWEKLLDTDKIPFVICQRASQSQHLHEI